MAEPCLGLPGVFSASVGSFSVQLSHAWSIFSRAEPQHGRCQDQQPDHSPLSALPSNAKGLFSTSAPRLGRFQPGRIPPLVFQHFLTTPSACSAVALEVFSTAEPTECSLFARLNHASCIFQHGSFDFFSMAEPRVWFFSTLPSKALVHGPPNPSAI